METYHGKSIFNGIAIGKICKYEKEQQQVKRIRISDPEAEINRFDHAREEAGAQLQALYDKALTQVGESGAMIFEIHRMMLDDDDYLDSVYHIIRSQQVNAEFAVASTGDNFSRLFASMDDEYMQGRAADVKDISDRLIRILMGQTDKHDIMEPVIIMAEDLAPSETVQMDKDNLLAFVTTLGSSNSHTAILARTMGIPALVGIPVRDEWNGKTAIVDGHSGTLIIEPDDALLAGMQAKRRRTTPKTASGRAERKRNHHKSGKRSIFTPISVMCPMLGPHLPMMRAESDCSAANFCIWKHRIIRPRRSSSRPIRLLPKIWQAKRSLSAHLISEPINRRLILICQRKKILRWAFVRSASVWRNRRSSKYSSVRSYAPVLMVRSRSCSQ